MFGKRASPLTDDLHERLGWGDRLHLDAPTARYDRMGLIWMLHVETVIDITATHGQAKQRPDLLPKGPWVIRSAATASNPFDLGAMEASCPVVWPCEGRRYERLLPRGPRAHR